jgi:multiple sugar transport system substrate-binding protein
MVSRKRFGALLLMLALLVPILAACGGSGTTTAPTAAPAPAAAATAAPAAAAPTAMADAPTAPAASGEAMTGAPKIAVEDGATLRVSSWGDPAEQKVNTDSFARFNQMYPNVTITYEPQPSDFQTKIKADFAGSTEPDVFYLDSSLMTALAPESLLLPLDDYLAEGGVKTDDYAGDLVSLFQVDGKTYALPKDQGSLALFINNEIAQAAGVDPASIKTWEDATAAAAKMTSGEGPGKVYGMCLNSDIQRVGAFMLQNGNNIVDNGKAVFNQDSGVKAVEWWYQFKVDGTGELSKEQGAGWCGEAFGKKTSAMVVEGGWMIPFMANPSNGYQDITYTALPLPVPAGGQQSSLVFTNGWAASARTKYPKAAAALVLFLTSAANQKPILETGFALPTIKSLLTDPYFDTHPNEKVLADAPSYGRVADLVFGGVAKKEDVLKPLNTTAMEPIFLGAVGIKEGLDAAAQEVDTILGQ